MSAGRLPVLDGFTVPGDRLLSRFQRGYYQCVTQVISTQSGASLVRVSATITAWYTDPVAGKSGYQVLPSNGRLENDFLDRLQEGLGDEASSELRIPRRVRCRAMKSKARRAEPTHIRADAGPSHADREIRNCRRFDIQSGGSAGYRSHGVVSHAESDRGQTH